MNNKELNKLIELYDFNIKSYSDELGKMNNVIADNDINYELLEKIHLFTAINTYLRSIKWGKYE